MQKEKFELEDIEKDLEILVNRLRSKRQSFKRLETIAEVHNISEDFSPTEFISIPNNARQNCKSKELQEILGREIDSIIKHKEEVGDDNDLKKYVFIKPKEEHNDHNSLVEAIVFNGNKEILI